MRLTAAAVAAVVALLAGCSGVEPPRWSRSNLSVPGEVVTLTDTAGGLLVGSDVPGATVRPHLSLVREGRVEAVPATPSPGYGAAARWLAVAADGASVTAVGGARGGAHGNVRWTQWSGTVEGVRDVPQSFWTFGGQEAGDVAGVAYLDGEPVVVGGWASPTTGYDIATYELEGDQWRRRSPGGPALASSRSELLAVAAVAGRRHALVVAGSTERLTADLPITAVVWTGIRDGSAIAWTRRDLPGAAPAEVRSLACDGDECLAVGRVRGHLATWLLRGEDAVLHEVTDVPVADDDVVLAPAHSGREWFAAVRTAAGGGHGVVGTGDGADWTTRPLPAGTPTALGAAAGGVWLATVAGGHSTLWAATEDGD